MRPFVRSLQKSEHPKTFLDGKVFFCYNTCIQNQTSMTASYQVRRPYLKNHTLHNFHKSAHDEKTFIESGKHFPVIHQLSSIFDEKWGFSIDYDTLTEYYGDDDATIMKNKSGIDCSFNIVDSETREIKKENFTIDWKIRFFHTSAVYDDFLAEIISQDFGPYSSKMPVPGWAVCNHKVNDAILYIIPGMNKAALVMRKELKAGFEKRRFPDRNRKYAKNGRYTTVSVPISWERLIKVCPSTIIFNYE